MNRKLRQIGRTTLACTLISGLVLCNSTFADAKKVSKEESVYVTTDADGSIENITVADWLKNAGLMNGNIHDFSDLSEITNVKGEETFTQSGDSIRWENSGNDIYYQGNSKKELPIELKISYTLDEETLSAKDMLGKSGKVSIHVEYINKSKTKKLINGQITEIYTPFVLVTGMVLSSDTFSNVSIDHGKILNDGNKYIIIGLGTPGLAESLNLSEEYSDQLNSDFTITADVTDFEMGNTFTYGSPNLLEELNVDEIDDLDELDDKLHSLTDASKELFKGTETLSDNMKTFAEKMEELESSSKSFQKDGVNKLTKGIKKMATGSKKLTKGVKKYTAGVEELSKGSKAYIAGANKISKGNNDLYNAVKDMPEQIEEFQTGLTSYTNGVDTLGSKENVSKLKSGTTAVSEGISTINTNLSQLKETYNNNQALIQELQRSISDIPDNAENKKLIATQTQLLKQLEELTNEQKKAIEQLDAATDKNSSLKSGADVVATSVATVMDSLNTLSGNSAALTNAADTINENIPTLVANIKALRDGSTTLTQNNDKLISGANQLTKSSETMNKSVAKVNSGMKSLKNGGESLNEATTKLLKGITGLNSASTKLSDGSEELNDGMDEFNREGIDKLNNIYNNDLQSVLKRLDAIIDAGKKYNNFSGLDANMKGNVKFIIETNAIEKED